MRTLLTGGRAVTYSKLGLMVLSKHFEQRKVEATFSSFRSMVPLSTPSGAQQTESELETELLHQLAFAPGIYDLLTQPIIHYEIDGKPRRYTPDIVVQLHATADDAPCRYIIEVKRRADLLANQSKYAVKFEAARVAAEHVGAVFRIMHDGQIRTPYLYNARMLARHLRVDPEMEAFDTLRHKVGDTPLSVTSAIVLLGEAGMSEPDARAGIEQAVAWRLLLCDLTKKFDDSTMISARRPGRAPLRDDDPILRALFDADLA